jgi:DNA-binding NarL/FixJ family response regulator
MTDCGRRISCTANNPEERYIAAEERTELRDKLTAALKTLTARQLEVVKLLRKDMTVTDIASVLGITKQSVNDIRSC